MTTVYRSLWRRAKLALALVILGAVPGLAQPDMLAPSGCGGIAQVLRDGRVQGSIDLPILRRFYDAYGKGCAWQAESAVGLIEALRASGDHGLDPGLFHAEALYWPQNPVSPDMTAERDVLLTDAALKYAGIVSNGLSGDDPAVEDQAADHRPKGELIDGLIDSLYSGSIREWLNGLAPRYPAYVNLQAALLHYRTIAEAGGWGQLPLTLGRLKKRAWAFAQLRARLVLEGDLAQDNGSERLDGELTHSIAKFQRRNGLAADGVLTVKTIERLNVSVSQRISVISLNMERLRVSLRDMPATRVEVNAPAATAVLFREGLAHLTMNVVVGAPKHETPELSSVIDTIVLNPPWNIPSSIIKNEIRPLLRRDPKYLVKNRMAWSGDQLVQEPGAHNALGRIKFDFPNRYSVYLHDTPARKMFTDPERAASHGCVRLQHPLDLAVELLLGDSNWNREAIEAVIGAGRTVRIALDDPMPVVISYQTAFVDEQGAVNFRPDIYGRDLSLTLRLAERVDGLKAEPAQW